MEMNIQMRNHCKILLEKLAKEDQQTSLIYNLSESLSNTFSWIKSYAKTDEEKKIVREQEINAIAYYQKSLEYNYDMLKQFKQTKDTTLKNLNYLVMTVDGTGKPKKTRVIDVQNGLPIFEDGCTLKDIWRKMNHVDNLISSLEKWMDFSGTLEEKLEKALKLQKKGKLGNSGIPETNYDLDHLSREQRDAQAWENYVIENGMYRVVYYDNNLDDLIKDLKECIEFYELATSIV